MDFSAFATALQNALGSHIPQILGAVAILVLGWLIAVTARAAVKRMLSMLKVNTRIQESTGASLDAESPVAVGVFWLVLLATLIAVLNVLNLSLISNPFAKLMGDVMGYLPNLLAGVVLSLVAWLIATVLRALAVRALGATSIDEKLSSEAGMKQAHEPERGQCAVLGGYIDVPARCAQCIPHEWPAPTGQPYGGQAAGDGAQRRGGTGDWRRRLPRGPGVARLGYQLAGRCGC